MVELGVKFKPNTSKSWAYKKLLQTGLLGSQVKVIDYRHLGGQLVAVISVTEEDRIKYLRAIRMIQQVDLVSGF